jgi:carbohydrate kinase (thermoresistant glucokinase family)
MILVLMGVSGSGKTTVGTALAERLGWPFVDGDDFHPPANVDKMSRGEPLTDADRTPWLRAIRSFIDERIERDESAIIACSALKQAYRAVLRDGAEDAVRFVYLRGDFDLIHERMRRRTNHFFDADLLASQFDALEPPDSDDAIIVDINQPPDAIADAIVEEL